MVAENQKVRKVKEKIMEFFHKILWIFIICSKLAVGGKVKKIGVALVKPKYEQFYVVGRGANKRGVVAWIRGSSRVSVW